MAKQRSNDIFENAEADISQNLDPEQIINIDFDALDKDSSSEARNIIEAIAKLYCDETFLKKNPSFKHRIDADIESIRINLRMRKADEIAHDLCLKNIQTNSGNASMYKSLTELQRTTAALTTKIEETIEKLGVFIKNYQHELNFEDDPEKNGDDDDDDIPQNTGTTYRGSKAFIEAMEGVDIPDDALES